MLVHFKNWCTPVIYQVHNTFLTGVKGLLVLLILSIFWGKQVEKAWALDFKTYLKEVKTEVEHYKEIIKDDPLDAMAYFDLGKAYLSLGRHEEEIKAYREAIDLDNKYSAVHFNLSIAYDLLQDGPNAIKHMLRALDLYRMKRNRVRIRKAQRKLKHLYLKYHEIPRQGSNN
tara:strand:+ start:4 stop:519 length:516 start_codon:yes stop_codon:yes gene_type:complete